MYPYLRFIRDIRQARRAPPLALDQTHVSHLRIWPGDIDPWSELNNGRTLTLYDLGRLPLAIRAGFTEVLKRQGWGLTVAGSVVRYRQRLTLFQKVEMRSRLMGADARFLYMEQSLWSDPQTCANHAILRTAVIAGRRMVPMAEVLAALGTQALPALPGWAGDLFAAESARPWPPERL
ncbi:acyl-CoA thioesterase [Pseudooceanicola sp. CBS1P-1]|uniref:Thioeseterase n=1 Tax=Pseudooceanicola albus TaxID=2692189 RepID=A0A6L7G9B7_9RHOB|nr:MULTISPECIES: acyl-CoA thioesterase [Pseudooceanicola]MBT9385887.1 acyl-CoA thioesterase [Pseudooceanicola endophyticus]MXN20118.1 thioeseterase [Pseudooceanicola albus]